MDGKFSSLKSLLELAEKLDNLPETTAIKVQKTLLSNKLQQAFEDFQKLGVSLPDLFAKFQGQLYKSEVLQAQDRIKNKEQETGTEPLLTDLINEDMIADLLELGIDEEGDQVPVKLYKALSPMEKEQLKLKSNAQPENLNRIIREYAKNVAGPKLAYQKRLDTLSDPMFQFLSQNILNLGAQKPSATGYDQVKGIIMRLLKQSRTAKTKYELIDDLKKGLTDKQFKKLQEALARGASFEDAMRVALEVEEAGSDAEEVKMSSVSSSSPKSHKSHASPQDESKLSLRSLKVRKSLSPVAGRKGSKMVEEPRVATPPKKVEEEDKIQPGKPKKDIKYFEMTVPDFDGTPVLVTHDMIRNFIDKTEMQHNLAIPNTQEQVTDPETGKRYTRFSQIDAMRKFNINYSSVKPEELSRESIDHIENFKESFKEQTVGIYLNALVKSIQDTREQTKNAKSDEQNKKLSYQLYTLLDQFRKYYDKDINMLVKDVPVPKIKEEKKEEEPAIKEEEKTTTISKKKEVVDPRLKGGKTEFDWFDLDLKKIAVHKELGEQIRINKPKALEDVYNRYKKQNPGQDLPPLAMLNKFMQDNKFEYKSLQGKTSLLRFDQDDYNTLKKQEEEKKSKK